MPLKLKRALWIVSPLPLLFFLVFNLKVERGFATETPTRSDAQVTQAMLRCSEANYRIVASKRQGDSWVPAVATNPFLPSGSENCGPLVCHGYTASNPDRNAQEQRRTALACMQSAESNSPTDSNQCAAAATELNRVVSEFNTRCTAAGMSGGVADCLKRARACTDCRGTSAATSSPLCDTMAQAEGGDERPRQRRSEPGSNSADARTSARNRRELAADERMFRICPLLAARDAAALSSRVTRKEERQERRRSDLDKDQEKLDAALSRRDQRRSDLQQAVRDAQDSLRSRIKALEEKLETAKNALVAQLNQIRQQIEEMGNRLISLTNDQTKAGNELFKAKAEMFARCHRESISKVTAIQQQRSTLAAGGKLSAGSTRNLLRSLGKSHAQKMQDLVKAYNRNCTNDPSYVNTVKVADDAYKLAMTQIEQERTRIAAARSQAEQAIAALQASAPDIVQRHVQDVARATQEAYEAIENLRQQYIQNEQSSEREISMRQLRVQNAERTIGRYDAEIEHDRNRLELRERYSQGRTGPEAGTIPSADTIGLEGAANALLGSSACNCSLPSQLQNGSQASATEHPACTTARNVLGQVSSGTSLRATPASQ